MIKYLTLLILFFSVNCNYLSAELMPADSAVISLLSENTETRNKAIEALIIHQEPATFPVIEAAIEGRLYTYEGKAFSETEGKYKRIYPVGIEEATIKEDELQPVKLSRAQRIAFNKILPVIHLTDEDIEKRKTAYSQLLSTRSAELLPLLKTQAGKENDAETAHMAIQVLRTLQLLTGDEADQHFALDYFSGKKQVKPMLYWMNICKEKIFLPEIGK
ncbi:MAG: hypothetical protein LIP01_03200 [Tannerellaceae bacterium]|nr:hypothetical protein [Tannerellaceae bacterium]